MTAGFSCDSKRIVTASCDKTARTWDAHSGRQLQIFRGNQDYVSSAVFSPDGEAVLTASLDGSVRLWRASRGDREIRKWSCGGISARADYATFNADGSTILVRWQTVTLSGGAPSAPSPSYAALWNVATGQEVRRFSLGDNGKAIMSPDGKTVLTQLYARPIKVWNAETGKLVREYAR